MFFASRHNKSIVLIPVSIFKTYQYTITYAFYIYSCVFLVVTEVVYFWVVRNYQEITICLSKSEGLFYFLQFLWLWHLVAAALYQNGLHRPWETCTGFFQDIWLSFHIFYQCWCFVGFLLFVFTTLSLLQLPNGLFCLLWCLWDVLRGDNQALFFHLSSESVILN